MGCCCSSAAAQHSPNHSRPPTPSKSLPPDYKRTCLSLNPPPPPTAEEETVKEVLSETPIAKPLTRQHRTNAVPVPVFIEPEAQPPEFFPNRKNKRIEEEKTLPVSQVSEICSASDSLSTATTATTATTVTEIRDDEATSKKRVTRSPGKVPRKRPYTPGERERAGRSQWPQPPGKNESNRQARNTQPQLNVATGGGVRRDFGERSGRRSRSPANRGVGGAGRGRVGGSPAKPTAKAGGRAVETAVGKVDKKESANDAVLQSAPPRPEQQEANESLDNPLVSLECFIFL